MTTDRERLTGALRGRYRIERELGAGGMATVYLAEDLKHHRQVAIKVLKPELAAALGPERFLREIEIAAKLTHPHILTLIDSGEAEGFLYYVMPYVDGESLRDRLRRERQLPLEDATGVVTQVADALSYAHSLGLVHRDIKPENILFEAGHAVVTDFGIARAVSAAGGERLTETGIALGTPAYMSPEQATGAAQVDGRSDIYALACVLYETLGGDPPFTGSSAQAILARHSLDPVPSLRTLRAAVPEAIEQVVLRALAKTPADRFATASQFADALSRASRAAELAVREPRPRRWRPMRMAAAAMGVGAVAVSVGWWVLAGSGAATARIRSLVVLPLDNLTGAPDQEYFVDGMHDALTTELSKIRALKVISRTSAMQYKGMQQPTPQTASELGVDGVIEGSVAREGDSVRITVQLIHGPTDTHLWTDTYQRELRNVLALQSEVARAIAEQIEVSLAPEEVGRFARAEVVDPAAYETYLRGQYHWNKLTPAGWKAAIDLLRQSLEQDPTYAPAYAMTSLAYSILGYYSRTPPAILHSRALAAAERAVALDSSLAEAHAGLAFVKFSFDWDWAGADQASQEALRLNPNATMALLSRAFYLSWVGRHDDAIAMLSRAVELDPVAPWANSWLAAHFFLARRYDEAIEQANKVLALEPDYLQAHLWLGYSYAKKGMYEEAAKALIVWEGRGWFDAWILALAGRSAEARRKAEQIPGALSGTSSNPYFHAVALGELSEKERALDLLEQAYQMRDPLMSVLKIDPRIDALREEPRFQELLRRMNFPN